MKKLLIILVMVFTLFTLVGCMSEEDYYTRDEVNLMIEEARASMQEEIDALKPTQEQRYMDAMLMSMFVDGSMQFAQVGDRVTGSVASWDYSYIIIELDVATTVELKMVVVAPDNSWDLNIYFGGMMGEADLVFENIESDDVYRVTLQAGFNTIELDSYSDVDYLFTIEILGVL